MKKDISLVADYMGNSVGMIKRHYAQTIAIEELNEYWSLTPAKVLESEQKSAVAEANDNRLVN